MVKHTLVISIDYDPLEHPERWAGDLLIRIGEHAKANGLMSMTFVDNLVIHNGKHPTANVAVLIPKPRVDPPRDEFP